MDQINPPIFIDSFSLSTTSYVAYLCCYSSESKNQDGEKRPRVEHALICFPPFIMKRLAEVLREATDDYEKKFHEIDRPPETEEHKAPAG